MLTHEVAKRLVERGHEITWFTSRPTGLAANEDVDGVRVVRRGSELSTRIHAPRFARRSRFEVVVEEINTLPYFSPVWSRAPAVLFIPQLARDVWWYEAPRLLAPLGYAAEPLYLSAYRHVDAITISASTHDDLRRMGLESVIHVIPMAVSTPAAHPLPAKTASGRLVFVGRLVRSKRVDHAVLALAFLRKLVPDATLTVVGDGPDLPRARELAATRGVGDAVTFAGRVSEARKAEILGEADVLVACSVREGWGLTVTEAARLGTPTVAYNVPGLRDSVMDGRTGLLTPPSPVALATAAHRLLSDDALYEALRRSAWQRASKLSWERTTDAFERALLAATASGS